MSKTPTKTKKITPKTIETKTPVIKEKEPTVKSLGIVVPPKIVEVAKPSKNEQILEHCRKHPPFYPAPTNMQWGTEIYPWLHKLEELLE